jgi:hypothetical protein
MRAINARRLVPLAAARVAAVCRRSWNRSSVSPASATAGSQTRLRKLLRRIGPPSAAGEHEPVVTGLAGRGCYTGTLPGRAARRLRTAEHAHHAAERLATAPGMSRRSRRSHQRTADGWATELAHAQREWAAVAGPTERQLRRALADVNHTVKRLEADKAIQALDRGADSGIHGRLAAINHELATLDRQPPDLPGVARGAKIPGPGLSL